LSRSREFLADAGSVELTKNPDAMISALRKIEGRGELPGATSSVMEMCIDNPREGFGELFDTHPSVDSRVTALVKFAGGHDPGPIALPPADEPSGQEADPRIGQQDDAQQDGPQDGPWGPAGGTAGKPSIPELSPSGTTEDIPAAGPWSQPAESGTAPASHRSGPTSPVGPVDPLGPFGPWGPHRNN
jgi:heat shock protein HtpX